MRKNVIDGRPLLPPAEDRPALPAPESDDGGEEKPPFWRQPSTGEKPLARFVLGWRWVASMNPAQQILVGYVLISLTGALVLWLIEGPRISALDHLFTSVSALSTTGLTVVSISQDYSMASQVVLLCLIQIGGIGYMTIAALFISRVDRMNRTAAEEAERTDFAIPPSVNVIQFAKIACVLTLTVEAIGAVALYLAFKASGIDNTIWMAIFHSVSAFCTSGLSLFPDSLSGFQSNPGVLLTMSVISIFGALGFLFAWDVWRSRKYGRLRLLYTNKVVLIVFSIMLAISTVLLFLVDTRLEDFDWNTRLLNAFFAAMTGSTTAGFSTLPTPMLGPVALVIVSATMIIGASPSGTSGGIKTTTIAVLLATTVASLRQNSETKLFGRPLLDPKIRSASATLAFYIFLATIAVFVLLMIEGEFALRAIVFEVLSALGTVGLSYGVTPGLSEAGKIIIILLMLAGRLGLLAFGIALASEGKDESELQEAEQVE